MYWCSQTVAKISVQQTMAHIEAHWRGANDPLQAQAIGVAKTASNRINEQEICDALQLP